MNTALGFYRPENLDEVLSHYKIEELQYIALHHPDIIFGWQELYMQNLFSLIVESGYAQNVGKVLYSLIVFHQRVSSIFSNSGSNIWGSYDFLVSELDRYNINRHAAWYLFTYPKLLEMDILEFHREILQNTKFQEIAEGLIGREFFYAQEQDEINYFKVKDFKTFILFILAKLF
jgi:hypothetical protein